MPSLHPDTRIGHVHLRVADLERAVAFYRDVLGFDLTQRYGGLVPGAAMFCGTLAAKGGIRPASVFRIELEDPVLKRRLQHEYRVTVLPVEG